MPALVSWLLVTRIHYVVPVWTVGVAQGTFAMAMSSPILLVLAMLPATCLPRCGPQGSERLYAVLAKTSSTHVTIVVERTGARRPLRWRELCECCAAVFLGIENVVILYFTYEWYVSCVVV